MNLQEIKQALLARLEDHLQYLLPAGKRSGNYYEVGSIGGEPGKSLRVCLSGSRAGIWMDGATGDAGDILDLWHAVSGNTETRETSKQLRAYLGAPEVQPRVRIKKKPAVKPPEPEESGEVEKYLDTRGIGDISIKDYGVGSGPDGSIAFPYRSPDGELQWVKYISLKRDERGKKRVWTTKDPEPILWGMELERNNQGRSIVITEGEIDAMTYAEHGLPAVSVPFGAKGQSTDGSSPNDRWIENCWTYLQDFETIYLSFDMDEEGERAVDAIIPRLGRERCRVVKLPGKDANSCHNSMPDLDLMKLIEQAKSKDPDDMVCGASLSKRVWTGVSGEPRKKKGIPIFGWGWDKFPWLLRPGEGTVLTGFANHGKSNFLYQMAAWLAGHDEKVFIGSYEESADEILGIMVNQAVGRRIKSTEYSTIYKQVADKLLPNIFVHDSEENVRVDKYFEYAEYAVRRYGCSVCVLDSLSTTDVDMDDKEQMSNFARRAREFYRSTRCHMIVVCHPRKGFDEKAPPLKQDIKGSGTIGDLFFNVLTVHRPEQSEYGASCPDGQLIVSKQKVGGDKPWLSLNYDEESSRLYIDLEDMKTPYIELEGFEQEQPY